MKPYTLGFRAADISADTGGQVLRIDRLRLDVRDGTTLQTDVDLKEGQKVVVGKSGLQGSDRALILVLSGKIVE